MDYPIRKSRPKKKRPDEDPGRERGELRLAEYVAPCTRGILWRTATPDLEFAGSWRNWKPERGRLH